MSTSFCSLCHSRVLPPISRESSWNNRCQPLRFKPGTSELVDPILDGPEPEDLHVAHTACWSVFMNVMDAHGLRSLMNNDTWLERFRRCELDTCIYLPGTPTPGYDPSELEDDLDCGLIAWNEEEIGYSPGVGPPRKQHAAGHRADNNVLLKLPDEIIQAVYMALENFQDVRNLEDATSVRPCPRVWFRLGAKYFYYFKEQMGQLTSDCVPELLAARIEQTLENRCHFGQYFPHSSAYETIWDNSRTILGCMNDHARGMDAETLLSNSSCAFLLSGHPRFPLLVRKSPCPNSLTDTILRFRQVGNYSFLCGITVGSVTTGYLGDTQERVPAASFSGLRLVSGGGVESLQWKNSQTGWEKVSHGLAKASSSQMHASFARFTELEWDAEDDNSLILTFNCQLSGLERCVVFGNDYDTPNWNICALPKGFFWCGNRIDPHEPFVFGMLLDRGEEVKAVPADSITSKSLTKWATRSVRIGGSLFEDSKDVFLSKADLSSVSRIVVYTEAPSNERIRGLAVFGRDGAAGREADSESEQLLGEVFSENVSVSIDRDDDVIKSITAFYRAPSRAECRLVELVFETDSGQRLEVGVAKSQPGSTDFTEVIDFSDLIRLDGNLSSYFIEWEKREKRQAYDGMDVQKFHLFPKLPPEIRIHIYLLATPPRIVHVQEETEDWELFEERFSTTPVQFKLHPSIAYFAHNWTKHFKGLAPWRPSAEPFSGQTTLEAHGFVTSKPKYQPWEPSAEVPEIPLNWLGENRNLKMAWAMTRQNELYSHEPIPALLHVCVESRAFLMNIGYQLAFGTRTSVPMTWFHFGRDTLHVDHFDYHDYEDRFLLGGSRWHIGQFMPEDLKRVQRLSLKDGAFVLHPLCYTTFHDSLRLMPNICHLYLVDWSIVESEVPSTGFLERIGAAERIKATQEEPWSFLPVEEIDCLPGVRLAVEKLGLYSLQRPPQSLGGYYYNIRQHKERHGPFSNLLDHNSTFLEAHFNKELKKEVPIKVNFVHLCDTVAATLIPILRQICKDEVIRRYNERRMAQGVESPRRALSHSNLSPRACTPSGEDPLRDDWEAFKEAHFPNENIETPLPPPVENEPFWTMLNEAISEHERTSPDSSIFDY
ncbi:hypothetical protein FQN54_004074 [Arachnomyces sp. PD_36]|nr:hypothetical protein FQN54_004074 [Arachnomyces sp. PD_36]